MTAACVTLYARQPQVARAHMRELSHTIREHARIRAQLRRYDASRMHSHTHSPLTARKIRISLHSARARQFARRRSACAQIFMRCKFSNHVVVGGGSGGGGGGGGGSKHTYATFRCRRAAAAPRKCATACSFVACFLCARVQTSVAAAAAGRARVGDNSIYYPCGIAHHIISPLRSSAPTSSATVRVRTVRPFGARVPRTHQTNKRTHTHTHTRAAMSRVRQIFSTNMGKNVFMIYSARRSGSVVAAADPM